MKEEEKGGVILCPEEKKPEISCEVLEPISKKNKRKRRHRFSAPTNAEIDLQEKELEHFARGINFYKLFLVLFIGSFVGVVVESIWCILKNGYLESRAGLIYGPFNLVYGFGALVLTLALYRFRHRSWPHAFLGGFLVGSTVEYVCSFVQELIFGTTSWDYSGMPFNLNGRICLLYSAFWGLLGILWIKDLYPRLSKGIMRIPNRFGKPVVWILCIFMIFNSIMSCVTVIRWCERLEGKEPSNGFETYLDRQYPNEQMEKIYANMIFAQDKDE